MKKMHVILLCAALAILTSCGEAILDPEPLAEETAPIVFNLTANHPNATKAVKTGWENGDAIFVFFDKVAAPKFLKMSYNGSVWSSAEYEGAMATPGALGLKNGDTGNMRAIFLPFGSAATVSASGTSFVFNKTYYTYYLTATLGYTVSNGKVNGAFQMEIPEGYVQFFVEDAAAQDEAYQLGCDAVIPTGVASISANGTITETSDKTAADDMLGYAYGSGDNKGYLFSGKLTTWKYGSNYYFAKTKTADGSRADYFVTGKTLSSHSAVKLPAASDVYALNGDTPNKGKWVPVGSGITVKLGKFTGEGSWEQFSDFGTWYTCNYGATAPEQYGTKNTFGYATSNATLPTKSQFETFINRCSIVPITVHGVYGRFFNAPSGFVFLPSYSQEQPNLIYWTSTIYENNNSNAYCLATTYGGSIIFSITSSTDWACIRALVNQLY